MRVKIGKYPDRLISHIHTNYMQDKYGYHKWPKVQSKFENFLEKLEDTVQWFYNVFNWIYFDHCKQTIKVRIDRQDTWNMDHTLAQIIVPMLKQLKEKKQGSPIVDDVDVPHLPKQGTSSNESKQYDILSSNEHDEQVWAQYEERWNWIMDEMIWAFEQKCCDNWEEQYYKFEPDKNERLELKLVWEDREGRQAHAERMANGFRLFGKYYEGLGD